MGLPVASHKSCPVHGKYDWKLLQTDIMDHLVKSSL